MVISILSVYSQMMTYVAVKANSRGKYRLLYFNIENTKGNIMMTVRVFSHKYEKTDMTYVCLVVSFQIVFACQCCVA